RASPEPPDPPDELAPSHGQVDLDAAAVVVPAVTADQSPVLQTVKEPGRRGGGEAGGLGQVPGGLRAAIPEAAQDGELGEGQPGLAPQLGLEPVGQQAGAQVGSQDLSNLGTETSLSLDHCHEVNGTHRVRKAHDPSRGSDGLRNRMPSYP